MLQQSSLHEFLELAETAKRVAVFQEVLADRLTPIGIFETLSEEMRDGVILESGLRLQDTGRYSFLAFDPMARLQAKNGVVLQQIGTNRTTHHANPFTVLRELISHLSCVGKQQLSDFIGSAVGFITYDTARLFETIPDRHASDEALPDVLFNFYRTTLTYDHQEQKLLVSMMAEVGSEPENIYHKTRDKITKLISKITASSSSNSPALSNEKKEENMVHVDIEDQQFMELVDRAKEYIVRGDAFQIVLSRCFKKQYSGSPFDIYRTLRRVSPAPYMFYLPIHDRVIVGASPERMISVQQGKVTLNPIAGTRRRSNQHQDKEIEAELLNDKKELAEHMMLVDLARNDLGSVCVPGSIQINELLKVKHYSHVSHIVSVISGQLREDCDSFDALAAAFPAGTLSGAPKIRAMQIIDELETSRRGLYGGAICRLDYQGNFDSCIAIRTAVLKDGIATVRTGAGIVYDSNSLAESNETRQKAQSMLDAISLAERELI